MENLNKSIRSRIRQLRKNHEITQAKLDEKVDITTKHISSVERGTPSLSLVKLISIGKYLDCTMDYLILGNKKRMVPAYFRYPSCQYCLLKIKKKGHCF